MMLSDLPEVKIVRHARATRLRLRIEPTQIRLTVPTFCNKRQIQNFMAQSEQWMIETWQKQQQTLQLTDKILPTELNLFNLQQPLKVEYQTQKHSFLYDDKNSTLYISDRQPEQYLKAFVKVYAKHFLPLYLQNVSNEIKLTFGQCSVRQPKTRWGSCTSKHDIMLNSALVLMTEEITRYVCVHELAHTRYFDHSAAFWSEVQRHDVNYQIHRKILKNSTMPYWWFTA